MENKSTLINTRVLNALNQVLDKLDSKELSASDFHSFICYLYGRLWQDAVCCEDDERCLSKLDIVSNIESRARSHGIILESLWSMTYYYAGEYKLAHKRRSNI